MKWMDLPQPMNCFTVRSAMMMDLDKRTVVQHYSANTKIVVVQKCAIPEGTYYRTETAKLKRLNWAFKASALGLPDEKAPLVPPRNSLNNFSAPATRTPKPAQKQKASQKAVSPKSGEARHRMNWISRLFRRNHG